MFTSAGYVIAARAFLNPELTLRALLGSVGIAVLVEWDVVFHFLPVAFPRVHFRPTGDAELFGASEADLVRGLGLLRDLLDVFYEVGETTIWVWAVLNSLL